MGGKLEWYFEFPTTSGRRREMSGSFQSNAGLIVTGSG
jgi:hypothetical protein